jgi:hypothetical protein
VYLPCVDDNIIDISCRTRCSISDAEAELEAEAEAAAAAATGWNNTSRRGRCGCGIRGAVSAVAPLPVAAICCTSIVAPVVCDQQLSERMRGAMVVGSLVIAGVKRMGVSIGLDGAHIPVLRVELTSRAVRAQRLSAQQLASVSKQAGLHRSARAQARGRRCSRANTPAGRGARWSAHRGSSGEPHGLRGFL